MSQYEEARTDTHCYHVTVWIVYGYDMMIDKYYATTRALLKDYQSEGLTMIDVMKARNGQGIQLHMMMGEIMSVVEITYVEYS